MRHNRISPRKSGYDYCSPGGYFITICTKNRVHYFGEVIEGRMVLNGLGRYCHTQIKTIESTRQNVQIHEYVVMPNHIHMIIVLGEWNPKNNTGLHPKGTGHEPVPTDAIVCHDDYQGPTIGQIINVFKGTVTKYANHHHIPFARQGRYHDRIIRNTTAYERIVRYIKKNPERWGRK